MPNSITITGRIGRDAETRYTQSGTAVLGFNVGSDVGYGERKHTLWFACSIFGKRAESSLSEMLLKGVPVTVFGELRDVRIYDKQDGTQGTSIEVTVNEVAIQSQRDHADDGHVSRSASRRETHQRAAAKRPAQTSAPAQDFDDDIPF